MRNHQFSRGISVWLCAGVLAMNACGGFAAERKSSAKTEKSGRLDYDPQASLKIAWSVGPLGYDPHLTRAQIVAPPIMNPIYDRLIFLDSKLELKPMLATSWAFSKDGRMLEFKLRK